MTGPDGRAGIPPEQPAQGGPPPAGEGLEPLRLSWRNTPGVLLKGAQAADHLRKLRNRRNFELVAVVLVIWFFLPDLIRGEYNLGAGSLVMILLALAAAAALFWYPGYANRRFAREKAAASPEASITLTAEGFSLQEGDYSGYTDFAQERRCAAAEYEGVVALSYNRNRVSAIPLGELTPDQRDRLRALLREGLGDRFEKIAPKRR